ncbi:hypothetical protein [Legionella cardiaca]|uniref:Lipoprotein n=1 Tax=Legionella cardiaca TaxID=1071983 RepID=A0ABY8AXI0_9GAMM|nr:hypothetical protein [Legionella cardiaca]WED44200.1 hypothetical protein PXX05_05270 [Legionella cardiaca]
MYKFIRFLFALSLTAIFGCAYASSVDLKNLIKVTNDNNPKCVIYYHYKNDLYCSPTASGQDKPDPQIVTYEKQKIIFDNRPWQTAWGKQTNNITTVEYVPAGDNVEDWYELITSQFIPGIQKKTTPLQFSEEILYSLNRSGFKPEVTYFEKSPNRVLFEFRITSPKNMAQDELQLVTKGEKGFYVLHYVIKEPDMGMSNRNKWLENLKKSSPLEQNE